MATLVTFPGKFRQDVQTFSFSFLNILAPGDSISTADITVRVFTGVDSTPTHILFEPLVIDNPVVKQKVQLGVVGVIYELSCTVNTALSYIHTIDARLAILPEGPPAFPNYFPFYLSSKPYPIQYVEFASYALLPEDGELRDIVVEANSQDEFAVYGCIPTDGEIREPLVFIFLPSEEALYNLVPVSGELKEGIIDAEADPEESFYFLVPIDGELKAVLISANVQPSDCSYSLTPTGGVLA